MFSTLIGSVCVLGQSDSDFLYFEVNVIFHLPSTY